MKKIKWQRATNFPCMGSGQFGPLVTPHTINKQSLVTFRLIFYIRLTRFYLKVQSVPRSKQSLPQLQKKNQSVNAV